MSLPVKILLFAFRLPTYVLAPIIFMFAWLVMQAGGPRDIFKGVVNSLATNAITFVFALGGSVFFAEPLIDTLNGLRTGQAEIQQTVEETSDEVKQILALLQKQSGQENIDSETQKSIENTVTRLLSASEGERKQAADKLLEGNVKGAVTDLQVLANKQEGAIKDAARTYMDIGNIAYMNDTHEALAAYMRVTELTPDDPSGWIQVGNLQQRLGNLEVAETAFQKVLSIDESRPDKMLQVVAKGNLGIVAQMRGDLDGAVDYYQQALALAKQLNRKDGIANQYGNLGIAEQTRGNLDGAVAYYQQALEINKQLGNQEGVANQYGHLGIVEQTRGNLDGAVIHYQQALEINEQLGRKAGMASNYGNLGIVEQTRGNLDGAVTYYQQALEINKQLGRKAGMANSYGNLGVTEQTRGNLDAAVDYYRQAMEINKQLGRKWNMAIGYGNLGNVEMMRGNLEEVCEFWRQAYDLFVEVGARPQMEQTEQLLRGADCADAPPSSLE